MPSFVGGVMTGDERLGFLQVGGERLVAVDLRTGTVLWHKESTARPVAATANFVFLLDTRAVPPSLTVLDAAEGRQRAVVSDTGMPAWASAAASRPESTGFCARDAEQGLTLDWWSEYRYTGGAAPRIQDQASHGREVAAGRIEVDLITGAAQSRPLSEDVEPLTRDEREQGFDSPPKPGEVARARTRYGDYVLRTVPAGAGALAVKLEARKRSGKEMLWEATLGSVARSAPPALRQ